jgi:hypothetical protein
MAAEDQSAVDCASWSGPGIAASVCDPTRLAAALETGLMPTGTGPAASAGDRQAADAPGLAQVMGQPLAPGGTLTLSNVDAGATITVRLADGDRHATAEFEGVRIAPGVRARVAARRDFRDVRLRVDDGRTIEPSDVDVAVPPTRPRLRVLSRTGRRVTVRIKSISGVVAVEQSRTCGSRALASHRAKQRVQTLRIRLRPGARYLRAVARDRSGLASRLTCIRLTG